MKGEKLVEETVEDICIATGGLGDGAEVTVVEDVKDDAEVAQEPEVSLAIKLRDAKNMAHDLLDFLMDKQYQPVCSSLSELSRHIEVELQQDTYTARHEQRFITDFNRKL